jgi:hypothetical protein
MRNLRREAELFPTRGVKLPCLSARSQSFVDVAFGPIEALRKCPRLVLGGHPKIFEKLSHNFATTLNFLLVGRSSGLNVGLALIPDRNAIGARRFLCHSIRSFTGCVFKEPSSVLKGGEQGCQRQLVNEVLGTLVTEFALNFAREGATPTQPGFNASLLGRI